MSTTAPHAVTQADEDLYNALDGNDLVGITKALRAGANPNRPIAGLEGAYHPAHYAVLTGNAAMLKALLAGKADPNVLDGEGQSLLILALNPQVQGDRAGVLDVLAGAGADVNERFRDGSTPLVAAIASVDLDAFQVLLNHGANPNDDTLGWTTMTLAMNLLQGACVPFVQALVKAGADVNQHETNSGTNRTPLLFALDGGSAEVTELLLDAGADPTKADRDGNTPVAVAKMKKDPLLAALLLKALADRVTAQASVMAGDDPAEANDEDDDRREDLVDRLTTPAHAVPQLDLTTPPDLTGDLEARFARLMEASRNGDLATVQALVTGQDLSLLMLQLSDGREALHQAAIGGHAEIAAHLIAHGADLAALMVTPKDGQERTPLDIARELEFWDTVAVLERAADVQGIGNAEHRLVIGVVLPDGGNDVRVVNQYTHQPITGRLADEIVADARETLAARKKEDAEGRQEEPTVAPGAAQPAAAQPVEGPKARPARPEAEATLAPIRTNLPGRQPEKAEWGTPADELYGFWQPGHSRILARFRKNLAEKHNRKAATLSEAQIRAMFTAVRNDDAAAVAQNAAQGFPVNALAFGGSAALHRAAGDGKLNAVAALIGLNADVNAVDEQGNTPLLYAIGHRHVEVAKLLLQVRGIDVNLAARTGHSPLAAAIQADVAEIVPFLLAARANIESTDRQGQTPLAFAYALGRTEIANMLWDKVRRTQPPLTQPAIDIFDDGNA